MRLVNCTQRSAEWFAIRTGRITASNIDKVLAKPSTEKHKRYVYTLAAEIDTQQTSESYVNSAMTWGIDNEANAIQWYEANHGVQVEPVGFVLHPTIDRAGCSPDGLISPTLGIEVKCPTTPTHFEYLAGKVLPEEYKPQVQFSMACCEFPEWEFVSYDPRVTTPRRGFVFRVKRDDLYIAELEKAILFTLNEVDEILAQLPVSATRTADRGLVYSSEPSPKSLAAQDMKDLEATWK